MTFCRFVRFKKDCDLREYKLQIMGIFNKLFNSSSETEWQKLMPWKELASVRQLDEIMEKSSNKLQVIFKHSTRCGISRMVKKQFENDFNLSEEALDLYYLDLLSYRSVSNEIQNRFKIQHESPQLIVLKNKKVVGHASHGAINDLDLKIFL